MLDLEEIAREIENGLNDQIGDRHIRFKIRTNAGEHSKPLRQGNEVTYFIDGILRPTGSENLGTIIDMGSWALTLEFLVPIPPPRTQAAQPAHTLQRVTEDQYTFFSKCALAIDAYFSIAENIEVKSEEGTVYSVGIRAGFSIPGTVDIYPSVGEASPITAYIQLGYVQDGINSRLAMVAIDMPENILPALSAEISRANVLSSDVYAGKTRRQSTASASALGIALQLPLTEKTMQVYDFLVRGEINVAHFVFYTLDGKMTVYWMMADEPVQAAREVSNIGLNVNLIEIADDDEFVAAPAGYQTARVNLSSSFGQTLSLSSDIDCYAHIGDGIYSLKAETPLEVALDERDFFDGEDGDYSVYIVTNARSALTARVNGTDVPVVIVKEANNG